MNFDRLEAWDMVEITVLWLGYNSYNTLMTLRDKKINGNDGDGNIT